ncbi:alternative ribosome rescue aminoacyl-tRNA hydrolase ArfB [uncultured Georgenia sp.]|uniref:alternative ribosome rescue aminoacyl-tRNA hydrolase ArfB n=1 Tax=uncultured Georgenia sp. TaxID=378209 RepID=UPI0026256553|nr:alternative ribosome rescue aminoacyl-tRNA hydrolase ArfB [uncultured Georgenia sp.]HLV05418.1 alternative ribosome rescue aminoacyl-tRNA hydrolase ArfB [Actinomycetaceae bacterium]
MTGDLRVTSRVVLPEEELQWRFSRASGPGGQGVNTTDSRVELSVDVARTPALSDRQRDRVLTALAGRLVDGRLTVTAAEHRSQLRNRRVAAERLAQVLREALAPPPPRRRPTRPTAGSRRRRAQAKARRSEIKALRRRPSE